MKNYSKERLINIIRLSMPAEVVEKAEVVTVEKNGRIYIVKKDRGVPASNLYTNVLLISERYKAKELFDANTGALLVFKEDALNPRGRRALSLIFEREMRHEKIKA